jgi:hypothetical protein
MAKIQPSTRSFSAGSVFLPGGSITFGNAGIVPDPDNPATLKAVYLDEAQTQIAQNPQPLDSNASFQQASDGILYGTGTYSVVWKNAAGVEVYQNLNFELQEDFGTAAFVNTGTASDEVPKNSDLTDVLRDSNIGQEVAGLSSPGATNWDSGNLPNNAPIAVNASGTSYTLPPGGTWHYYCIGFDNVNGLTGTCTSGSAAGGSLVFSSASAVAVRGWAQQVAN